MAKYPLDQLKQIKQKKLEEAERELRRCKDVLLEEEKKLDKVKKELAEVLDHRLEKLTQMRQELDRGTTSDKIEKMKLYLETVEEKRQIKDSAVKKQQLEVEKAEENVEAARKDLLKKQADVEKLKLHQKEWETEQKYLEKQESDKQTEEMGTAMHVRKKQGE